MPKNNIGGKRANKKPQTIEEKWPIPDNVTPKQKLQLEKIRRIAVEVNHGRSQVDNYEIKQFDVRVSDYTTSVVIETGLKGDEGTMASIIARDRAMIFIGKNGGMKHVVKGANNLKPTKYLSQAFYDYTYGKERRK